MIQWVGSIIIYQGLASLERAMHWQLGWFVFFTKKRLETQSSDISSNLTQWFSNFGFADLAARWFRDGFWRFWQLWPNMTGLQRIWVQGMSSRQGCEKTRKPFEPTRHFGTTVLTNRGKLKKSMVNSSLKDPTFSVHLCHFMDRSFNALQLVQDLKLQPHCRYLKQTPEWHATATRQKGCEHPLGFWVSW